MAYPVDTSTLPGTKSDVGNLRASAGQSVTAAEFNKVITAVKSLSDAFSAGKGLTLVADTSLPASNAGGTALRANAGRLEISRDGGQYRDFFHTYDVTDYGAGNGNYAQDTAAFRAAEAAAEAAGGGRILIPPGDYYWAVPELTRGNNEFCVQIGESNITWEGFGRTRSRIHILAPGGLNPATSWAVFQTAGLPARLPSHAYTINTKVLSDGHEWVATNSATSGAGSGPTYAGMSLVTSGTLTDGFFTDGGVIWRFNDRMFVGHGLYIKKKTNQNVDPIKNVVLKDFSIDGGVGWPDATYPLPAGNLQPVTGGGYTEATTGLVFDAGNKAIMIDGNLIDGVRLQGLEITGTRGEGFYYGGSTCKNVQVLDCDVHNTGGSGISASAGMLVRGCRVYHMGTAVESFHRTEDILFADNQVSDCLFGYVDGGNQNLTSFPWGKCTIRDNKFSLIYVRGFTNAGYGENYEIASNTWIDCGISSIDQEAIRISAFFGGSPRHVSVHDNLILADANNPASGITLSGLMSHVDVFNNRIGQTQQGVTNSKFVSFPINVLLDSASTRIRFWDNKWRTSGGVHVGTVATLEYTGFWLDTNYSLQDNGVAFQLQNANGSTDMYLKAPRHVIGGSTNHAYSNVPNLLNPDYMEDFQIVRLESSGGVTENFNSISQTGSKHDLRTKRFLNAKVQLVVQKDPVTGRWKEIDYYLKADRSPVTANDLDLASPNRIIDLAPVIEAYGCKQVTLAPTGATDFNNWADFPTGTDVRVIINANTTLKHNAGGSQKLALSGAVDWAPGGTGGETVFRVPTGATKAYEVSGMRITY